MRKTPRLQDKENQSTEKNLTNKSTDYIISAIINKTEANNCCQYCINSREKLCVKPSTSTIKI